MRWISRTARIASSSSPIGRHDGRNQSPTFPDTVTAVSTEGAGWLVDHGIRVVGTDFISIETAADPTFPVHRALLGAGVAIIEGLDLRDVPAGRYTLWCLPLKIQEGDGGPARVVLVED